MGEARSVRSVIARSSAGAARLLLHWRPRTGVTYVALGAIAFAGYFTLPDPWSGACFLFVSALALVALAVGFRAHRPALTRPWLALGIAQLLFLVGDGLWYGEYFFTGTAPASPSIADLPYLAAYPMLAVGILIFIRARQPRYRIAAAIDATLIGVAGVLVLWLTVIDPIVHDLATPFAERAVSVAYPLADALLLAAGAYLLLTGRHGRRALYLLMASIATLLAADVAFAVVADVGVATTLSDAFWMLSYLLFGAAALDPSMVDLSQPSEKHSSPTSTLRLVVLGAAIGVLPLFALWQRFLSDHQDLALTGIAGLAMLIGILLRMRELGEVLGRSEKRYASLLANASDAFAIVRRDGRFTYASPASDRVLGYAAGSMVGHSALEIVEPRSARDASAVMRRVATQPGSQEEIELPVLRADGQWRWLSVVVTEPH